MFIRLAQIESGQVICEQAGGYGGRRQRRAIGRETAKCPAMLVHKRRGCEHIVGIRAVIGMGVHVVHADN